MFSSKIIKINKIDEQDCRTFNLKSFNTGLAKKNRKALESAGIYYDLKDEDIASIKDLLQKTKHDAEAIIQNAEQQAEKIKKEAYQSGLEEGRTAGQKNAENRFAAATRSLQQAADNISRLQNSFSQDHQDTLINLSIIIAKKIIKNEIKTDPEFVRNTITSAVKMTMDREKLKIRINPEDLNICRQKQSEIMKEIDGIKSMEFMPDSTVDKGGAIIEYVLGEIDARIEKQFMEIENEISRASRP